MEQREKILAIIAFSATALVVVYLLLVKMVIEPTATASRQADSLEVEVEKLSLRVNRESMYRGQLHDYVANSYGDEVTVASGKSRDFLVKQFTRLGISGEDMSVTPVTGRTVGGGREVGWVVRLKGSQPKLTELLYQLQTDPHLHRVDTVTWTPVQNSTDLTLQFRFATLVLDAVEGQSAPEIDPDKLPVPKIGSNERKMLAMITERNIFLPYIKKPPPPPPPTRTTPRPPTNNEDPPPPPPPPPPPFQVVGLPSWGSTSADVEVIVKDLKTQTTRTYKVGESMLGGEIVMVDYRPLPLPKKPEMLSHSRVLVMIGPEIWAVELGHEFKDKHKLDPRQIPDSVQATLDAIYPPKKPEPVIEQPTTPGKTIESTPDSPVSSTDSGESNKAAAPDVTSDGTGSSQIPPSNANGAPTGSDAPTKEAGNAP